MGTTIRSRSFTFVENLLAILPDRPQPVLVRYGVTVGIILLSAVIQLVIHEYTGFTGFFLLLPGIFAAGILFDRGSGFLATLAGAGLAAYLTPLGEDFRHLVPLTLFVLTGFATAIVSEGLRKILEKLATADRTKDLLLRELEHRTKNNLAIMSSLLHFQARAAPGGETRAALRAASSRIRVMADLHNFLKPSGSNRLISMDKYLNELFDKMEEFHGQASITLSVAGHMDLPESYALPIAILTNELVTNSLKHGFPDGRAGNIEVKLGKDGGVLLEVRDNGVGCPTDTKEGVGSRLMHAMAEQLSGTLSREHANPGCRTTVRVPFPS
jgi:two-component system, sensor histidine kinase PdtaS